MKLILTAGFEERSAEIHMSTVRVDELEATVPLDSRDAISRPLLALLSARSFSRPRALRRLNRVVARFHWRQIMQRRRRLTQPSSPEAGDSTYRG